MMRALLLPLATVLALATGAGMIGVATTLTDAPIILVSATASDRTVAPVATATPSQVATPGNDIPAADIRVTLPTGPVIFRVTRLTLAPDEALPVAERPEPIVLLVESGVVVLETGINGSQTRAVIHRGQHEVVQTGTVHVVLTAGEIPAVVLVMTITPDRQEHICPDPVWCGDRA